MGTANAWGELMGLSGHFDAVLMLSWSDWETEPRSNRYHYASRFARELPVLFFQHRYLQREGLQVVPSELPGLDIVHVTCGLGAAEAAEIRLLLRARGIARPLVWIWDSLYYKTLIDALPRALLVYHATEDYFVPSPAWSPGVEQVAQSVRELLARVHFVVYVSAGLAQSYALRSGYTGPGIVAENGCDAEALARLSAEVSPPTQPDRCLAAIFQGGINKRLDYVLLDNLTRRMPDWELRFAGRVQPSEGWTRLLRRKNVRYLGELAPDEVAREMGRSTVGIIPFIQDEWVRNSLPLKAFEYVACGLPVVTVPITALESEPELFAKVHTADEMDVALRAAAALRWDPTLLEKRRAAAAARSYDRRFAEVCDALAAEHERVLKTSRPLVVGMLSDAKGSLHVNTILEHLESFRRHSRHSYAFIPATSGIWKDGGPVADLSAFDAVAVHYSVRLSIRKHLDEGLAQGLEAFSGVKVLFIQDEYEGTEIARAWMDRIGFDLVYTCVPLDQVGLVYPAYRFPATEFLPTLTGYVPEDPSIERYARPLVERRTQIAYRGRRLHPVYGQLGYEKWCIGQRLKAIAEERGLPVDIEVDDAKRIYGPAWYEFLGSARATLATESGSNVFDVDGMLRREIARLQIEQPDLSYDAVVERVVAPHEGPVRMNQVSPKIFEAIRLHTALILFEGSYSGVVVADRHYIPLKKDFSNLDEVLAKLADDELIEAMTERAYREVLESGRWSYRTFVAGIDLDLERRLLSTKYPAVLCTPAFAFDADGTIVAARVVAARVVPAAAPPATDPVDTGPAPRPRVFGLQAFALRVGGMARSGIRHLFAAGTQGWWHRLLWLGALAGRRAFGWARRRIRGLVGALRGPRG